MAFKKIEVTSEYAGELPWASSYLQRMPSKLNELFPVKKVIFGEKGVFIETDDFKAFLYKSNPYYAFLLEALETWESKKLPVHALACQLVDTNKACIELGIEDSLESTWRKDGNRFFTVTGGNRALLAGAKGTNPLLAKTNPPPSSETTKRARKVRSKETGMGEGKDDVSEAAESLAKTFKTTSGMIPY